MELTVKMSLNGRQQIDVTFTAESLQDCIRAASPLLDFNGKCGICESDDIKLQSRKTQKGGYKYTEYVCNKCGGRLQWGAYQDGSGFFLKDWEPPYEKK